MSSTLVRRGCELNGDDDPLLQDDEGEDGDPTENIWSSFKRSMANLAPATITDPRRTTKNRLKAGNTNQP